MNAAVPTAPAALEPKVWAVASERIAEWMRRERQARAGVNTRGGLDIGLPRPAIEKLLRQPYRRA